MNKWHSRQQVADSISYTGNHKFLTERRHNGKKLSINRRIKYKKEF